jgi:hypothetical protein
VTRDVRQIAASEQLGKDVHACTVEEEEEGALEAGLSGVLACSHEARF